MIKEQSKGTVADAATKRTELADFIARIDHENQQGKTITSASKAGKEDTITSR